MKTILSALLFLASFSSKLVCQVYPTFGNETQVTITGYTLDAMEPHLSADGNALFFNSLNDGITTSLDCNSLMFGKRQSALSLRVNVSA